MQDTELYRRMLGLESPWTVESVDLDMKEQRVDVRAGHQEGLQWPCPDCGALLSIYDHSEERMWRHLDSMQFKTFLHARAPRVNCSEHGVKQVKLPWSEPRSRFTAMFERFAIDVLLQTDITGACRILRVTWDEAWHIQERAVERGLAARKSRVLPHLGVDEKSFTKRHNFMTLVCDLDAGCVEYVGEERTTESLESYFRSLTKEQLEGIEVITTDMWNAYIRAIRENVPHWENKLVFDRYHVMKNINHAVDLVRRKEHKELRAEGDETLARSRYLWLYAEENIPEARRAEFDELRHAKLRTARAWAIKESLRELWNCRTRRQAEQFWRDWFGWASRSRLKQIVYAARTVQRHLYGIFTYFAHRRTNAVLEGINSKIQTVKKRAFGFRNRDHFKTAIFFHCGGLQLYPATHAKAG
jgi:transposase